MGPSELYWSLSSLAVFFSLSDRCLEHRLARKLGMNGEADILLLFGSFTAISMHTSMSRRIDRNLCIWQKKIHLNYACKQSHLCRDAMRPCSVSDSKKKISAVVRWKSLPNETWLS